MSVKFKRKKHPETDRYIPISYVRLCRRYNTIVTDSDWISQDAALEILDHDITDTETNVLVRGGTDGEYHMLENKVYFADGQTEVAYVQVQMTRDYFD